MKIQYYDKDSDKWNVADIRVATVETSDSVVQVYGDNIKCLHHNDEPGKCPVCGRQMYWEPGEMLFGGLMLALVFGGLFCMGIYIYKSLFT